MFRILFVVGLLAGPVHAATINEVSGPGLGSAISLETSAFVGSGPCGYGLSVINDGCSVVKKDASSPVPYGRFDPFGGSWIDSQDLSHVVWTLESDVAMKSVTFALTDAFDQGKDSVLGTSNFSLTVNDAIWTIASRESNGTLHWLEVFFDTPTKTAELIFQTRLNDGWGVSSASVVVTPLPAAAYLMIAGIGALAIARRRRLKAA